LTKKGRKSVVVLTAFCVASAICGLGCGGGGTTTMTPPPESARLVVVEGTASAPLSVSLDGQVLDENLAYLTSTNPLIVPSGPHQLLLQNSSGPLLNGPQTFDLTSGSHTTVVYYGWGAFGVAVDSLTDDTTPADGSMAKLRIADYASSVPGVNVYVVPFGSGPSGPSGTPALTNLGEAAQKATYQVVAPGNYDIYFTANGANGSPMTVFYHTGSFPLAANQNRSVYFLNLCSTTENSCNLSGAYAAVTVADLN
jgi:Domain of unknown function (DUF4397)